LRATAVTEGTGTEETGENGFHTEKRSSGEEQRRDAFHLGINLILYAMTENYKDDLIHVPFIRKRLTR